MKISRTESRVKISMCSDVSELTTSPSSECGQQFWFYQTTSTPWRWGRR